MSGSSPTADGYYDQQPHTTGSASNPYYPQHNNPVDPAYGSGGGSYGYGQPSYAAGSPLTGGLQQESDIRGGPGGEDDGHHNQPGHRRRTSSLSRAGHAQRLDDEVDGQYGLGGHDDERGYGGAGGILGDDGMGGLGHAITLAEPFSNDINSQDLGGVGLGGGLGGGPDDLHHGDPMGMHGGQHHGHMDNGGYRSELEGGDGSFLSGGDMALGGANAKVNDDKQRKRIIQACEPCRIRKAKCNGSQPCVRCGARNLSCEYAHERRMRGPNRVKKTASEKAASSNRRKKEKALKEAQKNGTVLPVDDAVIVDADGNYQADATMAQIAAAAAAAQPGSPKVKEEPGLETHPSMGGFYEGGSVSHGHGISSWSGPYANQWDRGGTSASRGHVEDYDRSERGWHEGDQQHAAVAGDYPAYGYDQPQYQGEPPSPATAAAQHGHAYPGYQSYPPREHTGNSPILDDPRSAAFTEADLDAYGAEPAHAPYETAEPAHAVEHQVDNVEGVPLEVDGQQTSGEVTGAQVAQEPDLSSFALFGEAVAVQNAQEQEVNGEGRWDTAGF